MVPMLMVACLEMTSGDSGVSLLTSRWERSWDSQSKAEAGNELPEFLPRAMQNLLLGLELGKSWHAFSPVRHQRAPKAVRTLSLSYLLGQVRLARGDGGWVFAHLAKSSLARNAKTTRAWAWGLLLWLSHSPPSASATSNCVEIRVLGGWWNPSPLLPAQSFCSLLPFVDAFSPRLRKPAREGKVAGWPDGDENSAWRQLLRG